MYTLGYTTPIVAGVATAVVLPNTGVSSNVATLAAAVFVGLISWGVMYARTNR
jgi:LPXTG-motif cell wall-anchored protein